MNDDKGLTDDVVRLVGKVVWKFSKAFPATSAEDLMQVGLMAAMRAIEKFDASKGVKLSTWVTHVVTNDVRSELKKGRRRLGNGCDFNNVPDRGGQVGEVLLNDIIEVLKKRLSPFAFKLVQISLTASPSRVTYRELAEELGLDVEQVMHLKEEVLAECREKKLSGAL